MERLTEHVENHIQIKGCTTIYSNEERNGAPLSSAIARLAAYEDAMTLERAQELAQAEKDGRLVVLPPNDPLTLEELGQMCGEPVWCEEYQCWGIVTIEKKSMWANHPFLCGYYYIDGFEVEFERDIEGGGLTLYRRKPEEVRLKK